MPAGPDRFYSLIDTHLGDDPAVLVINSALPGFSGKGQFPWHLRVIVQCRLQGDNGMPTTEEMKILRSLEETIEPALEAQGNAIFLARITSRGERVFLYRVHDPEEANDTLQRLMSTPEPIREWEYHMEYDLEWDFAKPELDLLSESAALNAG